MSTNYSLVATHFVRFVFLVPLDCVLSIYLYKCMWVCVSKCLSVCHCPTPINYVLDGQQTTEGIHLYVCTWCYLIKWTHWVVERNRNKITTITTVTEALSDWIVYDLKRTIRYCRVVLLFELFNFQRDRNDFTRSASIKLSEI